MTRRIQSLLVLFLTAAFMMTLAGIIPAGGESTDGEGIPDSKETEISEPVTETEPENVSESRTEPKSNPEPISDSKNDSATDPDPDNGSNVEADSDSGMGNESKDAPVTGSDGDSAVNPDSGFDSGSDSDTGFDSGTGDESKEELSTGPEGDSMANPDSDSDSAPVSDSGADQEPGADPEVESNSESDPEENPQQQPDPNANPEAEPVTIQIAVAVSEGVSLQDGAYVIPKGQNAEIIFSWSFPETCDMFHIQITGTQDTSAYDGVQKEDSFTLSISSLAECCYVFKVYAITEGKPAGAGQYPFSVAFSKDDEENTDSTEGEEADAEGIEENAESKEGDVKDEEDPSEGGSDKDETGEGGRSGSSPGGGFGGRPSGDGNDQSAQAPRITAGKALTSTHASGSKTMDTFGTVDLSFLNESMMTLRIHDRVGIQLDEGEHAFTATIEDESLVLKPEITGEVWAVNGYTLKALARSGVSGITMMTDAGKISISTEQNYQGTVYATLCASGVVSADYEYLVSAESVQVLVAGSVYFIDDSQVLIPVK